MPGHQKERYFESEARGSICERVQISIHYHHSSGVWHSLSSWQTYLTFGFWLIHSTARISSVFGRSFGLSNDLRPDGICLHVTVDPLLSRAKLCDEGEDVRNIFVRLKKRGEGYRCLDKYKYGAPADGKSWWEQKTSKSRLICLNTYLPYRGLSLQVGISQLRNTSSRDVKDGMVPQSAEPVVATSPSLYREAYGYPSWQGARLCCDIVSPRRRR